MLYCRELFGIQIRYGIREDCSGTRLFPCREFHAAGIRQDWYGIPDYPYNERYYAGTAGHDHDPSYDGDSTDDVYRGHCDGRVERPGLTTVLLIVLPILALAIFLIAKKGFRSSKRSR